MRHIITIALVVGASLVIGDTAASIALAAGMIAAAVVLTVIPERRSKWTRRT